MLTEIDLAAADLNAVRLLIQEYLHQGGTGHDAAALDRALACFDEADRIVVLP